MLEPSQVAAFDRDGYIVMRTGTTADRLAALQAEVVSWIEASRFQSAPFGPPTIDGRPRFDMGQEHSPATPALRRINNPSEISAAFETVMRESPMVDAVADLIGPDVKFHHCKVNLKLPGSRTEVGYHQDFAFTPHTNDSVVTALLMLDEMTLDNGCLTVIPGSHRGPLYSLYEGDRFVGKMSPDDTRSLRRAEVAVIGQAGDVCLMHSRLAHGSEANRSGTSRGLYICVYSAADAFALKASPMPNPFEGLIVRGRATRVARLTASLIELPDQAKTASFFSIQGQASPGAS